MRKHHLSRIALLCAAMVIAAFAVGCDPSSIPKTDPAVPTYGVTYIGNGNTAGTAPRGIKDLKGGETITIEPQGSLAFDGKKFIGWAESATATGAEYLAGKTFVMPAKDVVLYAVWESVATDPTDPDNPPIAKVYTVTFDSNGGSAVAPQRVNAGDKATRPAAPTKSGFSLDGWYRDAALKTAWAFASDTVTGDVTLYAKWAANATDPTGPTDPTNPDNPTEPAKYTLSYDGNGNDSGSAPASISAIAGQSVTIAGIEDGATPIAKNGCAFKGWALASSASAVSYVKGDSMTMPSRDVKLYAVWQTRNRYTVTFVSNGGGDIGAISVYEGEKIARPSNPTKTRCEFAGWYADPSLTEVWDFSNRTVTSATTLYAKWTEAVARKVYYDGNGSTANSPPKDATLYYTGDTVTVLSNRGPYGYITRRGYYWLGWSRSPTATQAEYKEGSTFAMPSEEVTLYAVWGQYVYLRYSTANATFNDTNEAKMTQALRKGEKGAPVTVKPIYGYHFVKWSDGLASPTRTDSYEGGDIELTAIVDKDSAITIAFKTLTDEDLTLDAKSVQLSQYNYDVLTVTVPSSFDSYAWYIDGVAMESKGAKLEVSSLDLLAGKHSLTAVVTRNGVPFTKQLAFSVAYE